MGIWAMIVPVFLEMSKSIVPGLVRTYGLAVKLTFGVFFQCFKKVDTEARQVRTLAVPQVDGILSTREPLTE